MSGMHIDHGFMNMPPGNRRAVKHILSQHLGLPIEIAEDIVERAYWLQSDEVCRTCCSGFDCCHVIGYEDVYHSDGKA